MKTALKYIGGFLLGSMVLGLILTDNKVDNSNEIRQELLDEAKEIETSIDIPEVKTTDWHETSTGEVLEAAYHVGCNEDGTQDAFCECSWEEIEQEFDTVDEFEVWINKVDATGPDARFNRIVFACFDEIEI